MKDYIYGKSTDFHTKKVLIFVQKSAQEPVIFLSIDQSALTSSF